MGGCLLHINELPLPQKWMEVQKVQMLLLDQLAKSWTPMCHNGQPLLYSQSIFPNDVFEDLSTDQYY